MSKDKIVGLNQAETDNFNSQIGKTFAEQAQFWLNAIWADFGNDAEQVWKFVLSCKELDKMYHNALPENKKGDGYKESPHLDEFWSHKILESYGRPMSVVEFRNEFKTIDLNFDKQMSLLELLIYWYKVPVKRIAQYEPGTSEEVEKCQAKLAEVADAFSHAQTALDKAATTEASAKKTKAAATSAATEAETKAKQSAIAADEAKKSAAVAAESAKKAAAKAAEAQAAEDELKAALADLKSQEDAYAKKTKELEQKSEGSGVAAMRAKNELAQHLGEDPLPLRKAKLTTEAATKKAEKARVAAEDSSKVAQKAKDEAEAAATQAQAAKAAADNAHKVAQKAKEEAEAAAAQAEADRVAAEAAVVEAEKALEEAQEALEAAKKKRRTYPWYLLVAGT